MKKKLGVMGEIEMQYVSIVDAETLLDKINISGDVIIAVALKLGKTRLIDNIFLSV